MTDPRISLISPTGALGMGFLDESLERGISLKPDVIACDAGSTDSGPFYLGSGTPKMSRRAILQDLRRLLLARDRLKVPLIIGSCGTSGVDSAVDWMRELTLEIAKEEGLSFRISGTYKIPQDTLIFVEIPAARAIKFSFPRPRIQGDLGETDMYSGQQYAPLLDLQIC